MAKNMTSIWIDELDIDNLLAKILYDFDCGKHPELNGGIERIKQKWMFEFDTVDNRKEMKQEFIDIIIPYVRDKKINFLLNDDKS